MKETGHFLLEPASAWPIRRIWSIMLPSRRKKSLILGWDVCIPETIMRLCPIEEYIDRDQKGLDPADGRVFDIRCFGATPVPGRVDTVAV